MIIIITILIIIDINNTIMGYYITIITSTGWWYTYPSEKYEFVSWDYPNWMESHKIHVPNPQPVSIYLGIGITITNGRPGATFRPMTRRNSHDPSRSPAGGPPRPASWRRPPRCWPPWASPRRSGTADLATKGWGDGKPWEKHGKTHGKCELMWVKQCHVYHPWLGTVSLYHHQTKNGDDWGMVQMASFYPH